MKKPKLDLPADTKRLLILVAAFAALLLFTGAMYALFPDQPPVATPVITQAAGPEPPVLVDDPAAHGPTEFNGRIGAGQPFITALLDAGLERAVCDTVQKHLESAAFNFRKCMPGQAFPAHVDSTGALHTFRYEVGKLLSYWIVRDNAGALSASRWEIR